MKQHVTVEQICSSTQTFDRISEIYVDKTKPIGGYTASEVSEWLTIGQMIELLQNKVAFFSMSNMFVRTEGTNLGWGIIKPKYFDIRGDELCDVLWCAVVREVL